MADRSKKILVVEDDDIQRQLMVTFLKEQYQVGEAGTGELALIMLGNHKFDVVMLDIQLPGISGIDVARAIRQNPAYQDIKIVFATAEAPTEELLDTARSVGANDLITKPYAYLSLHDILAKFFGQQTFGFEDSKLK